jgi:AcrR family transcriptional regulator
MSPIYKPEYYDFLYEKSSRNRILGYDNTSTAVIARNAGTSESQLMKHFGGKANLLETIFSEGWERINNQLVACFQSAADLNGRFSCIPGVVFESLDQDLELKTLVLLEGHRMRDVAQREPAREGYARFLRLIDEAIADAAKNGEFRSQIPSLPLRSAIVGMVVSGARQQVLASRTGFPANYGSEEFRTLVSAFLSTVVNNGTTLGRQARVA